MNRKLSARSALPVVLTLAAAAALGLAVLSTLRSPAVGDDVLIKPAPVAAGRTLALADEKPDAKSGDAKADLPPGTGIVRGVVTFDGKPPDVPPLFKKGDASQKDPQVCAEEDMPDESLLVNESAGNAVANVAVYLRKTPSGFKPPALSKDPLEFDQKGCRFFPRMLIARVGQTILVKSDDMIAHNTHTVPLASREFNSAIGAKDRVGVKLVYDKTERLPVMVKCDLHTWMRSYHIVTDNGLAGATNEKGEFEILGVPAGSHDFTIWHERPGYLELKRTVKVEAGKTTDLKLAYPADKWKSK